MTGSHHGLRLALGLITCLFLCGCASNSPQRFSMSFLPPAPRQAIPNAALVEAPSVPSNSYIAESPFFMRAKLDLPPRPSQVDMRIRRADERFLAGKRLYDVGDTGAARQEFDAAIDILLSTPEQYPDRAKIEPKLEQLVSAIHKFDVNRLGAGDLSGTAAYDKAPLEDILELTFPVDPNLKPKVNEQLLATVSQLPLELNDSVLSYINYFSSDKGRKTLEAGLRRAGRYRELISRILKEEGVPQELIYLAQAESGFLPRAISHKAAVGMWQFVQARGRQYGLMQTPYTDDRLDPEKATRSAARHLRDLYGKFGDWYLAIAGYNCGDGCIDRAVQRTGYADFWRIRSMNALPRETTNYVPIILALTIMHKNAKDYGIDQLEPDPPLQYDKLELTAPTHLALVADAADRSVSDIRDLNPALLSSVAPAGYSLRVPTGSKTMVLAGLEAIPAERRASWRIHRVAAGDTMQSIARQYNMSTDMIMAANKAQDAEIGDVLIIPTSSQVEKLKKASRSSRAAVKKSTHAAGSAVASRGSKQSKKSSSSSSSSKVASRRKPASRGVVASLR